MPAATPRVADDLRAAAEQSTARDGGHAQQHLDRWARLGMHLTARTSAARQRGSYRRDGDPTRAELTDAQLAVADAQTDVRISQAAKATSFAQRLADEGVTTVVADSDGHLIERRPDGTETQL